MRRGEPERLRDIGDAIRRIDSHLSRVGELRQGSADPLLQDALLFELVVIGEAVKHLSDETVSRAPAIPWRDIAGLRDVIAHGYFRIDMERVRAIVERDIPALARAIEELLEDTRESYG